MATPPKIDAFLVCDHVHKDGASLRYTLVSIWDTASSLAFPSSPATLAVYVNLTGLNGSYRFRVSIIAPDLSTEVASAEIPTMTADDPLERDELGVVFRDVIFSAPGRYTVRFAYNGVTAAEITIELTSFEEPSADEPVA